MDGSLRLNSARKRTGYPEVPDVDVRAALRTETRLRFRRDLVSLAAAKASDHTGGIP